MNGYLNLFLESLGCFHDQQTSRRLPFQLVNFMMTINVCIGACYRRNYNFAGLQTGSECWCGYETNLKDKLKDDRCDIPCSGNKNELCGGKLANQVYKTGKYD